MAVLRTAVLWIYEVEGLYYPCNSLLDMSLTYWITLTLFILPSTGILYIFHKFLLFGISHNFWPYSNMITDNNVFACL